MVILACSPKYAPKLTEEEKARRKAVRDALRPGLVLEFITSDYHEDEVTPPGFHEIGDRLELVRIARVLPIIRYETKEKVGEYDVWLCKSSRWGEREKDAPYLEAMTRLTAVG